MIVASPPEMPVTTPVLLFTVATEVLLLLQAPPVVSSLRVIVAPGQTLVEPVMLAGNGLTEKVEVFEQPSPIV